MALALQTDKKLLGEDMKFKRASEPTDIIWENRIYTQTDYVFRQIVAYTIIGILLFGSFAFIYKVARTSSSIAQEFPVRDCDQISSTYGQQLQKYAVIDYDFVVANDGLPSSGALQCFCAAQFAKDYDNAVSATFGHPQNKQICQEYNMIALEVFVWLNSLKYFITGVNFVLRTICIKLVAWIGYPTETVQLLETTKVTFAVQFFNTAFLLLLTNADLSEQPFSFGLTGGLESDFDQSWFKVIGNTLVGTMIFTAIFPIMEAFGFFALRLLFRILDRGFTTDPYTTSKTSIQAYINSYAGPVYMMHFKYSALLNIIFVTMTYGFGIPILFPIAAFAILVLYLVEKTMLYYAYRLPPMYDERLSQSVLNMLNYAPLFFLGFGYWMASNKQMLSNENLFAKDRQSVAEINHHTVDRVIYEDFDQSPSWPMLLLFVLLFINQVIGNTVMKCLYKCFPNLEIGDIELDEDIDNYWVSLDDKDRNWAFEEDRYSTEKLGIQILTKKQKAALENSEQQRQQLLQMKPHIRSLQGCHSYDILCNPLYFDDFQYVSASVKNRDLYIIDDDDDEGNDAVQSDIVRIALNLAYMNEQEAREFVFDQASVARKIEQGRSRALL